MRNPLTIERHPRYAPMVAFLPLPSAKTPHMDAATFVRSMAERVDDLMMAALDRVPLLTWRVPINSHHYTQKEGTNH